MAKVKTKEKKTKQKKVLAPKISRNTSMIQETAPSQPSISRDEALSRACLVINDLTDAISRSAAAVLVLGQKKVNATAAVQALAEAERNAIAAAEHAAALRLRIAATPSLDKAV